MHSFHARKYDKTELSAEDDGDAPIPESLPYMIGMTNPTLATHRLIEGARWRNPNTYLSLDGERDGWLSNIHEARPTRTP